MSEDSKYPKSSPGVAKLLNMTPASSESKTPDLDLSDSNFSEATTPPPVDLPIEIKPVDTVEAKEVSGGNPIKPILPLELKPINPDESKSKSSDANLEPLEVMGESASSNSVWGWVKFVLPWIAIFGIGLGLYFFYFSDFSFYSLFNSDKLKIESISDDKVTNANLDQLKEDVAKEYQVWIANFFADVTDESIIAMDADVSGNGLTNLEKYLLNLNPKVYSTRGGSGDGQLVLEGINPWTGKKFTDKQKQLIDKYINPELISNRITAAAITRGVTKYSQYVNPDSPYYIDPATLSQIGNGSNQIVSPTQIATSNISNNNNGEAILIQPNNGNSSGSPQTILNPDQSIDQKKPGLLEIPSYSITVPIIWTQDVKDFDSDLRRGAVHYPGTALPGEVGTSYISGHSSGYAWDKSPYKQIFAKLGSVADGTSFTITATQKDGKTVKFSYVVQRRGEFQANDQAQFVSTAESIVALSTCWPIGTVERRLVLFGTLTQTDRN